MRRPRLLQAFTDHLMGQFRRIAIAAEMAQINPLQSGGNDLFGEAYRAVVGKMAVPAQDPLFQAPRSPADRPEAFSTS